MNTVDTLTQELLDAHSASRDQDVPGILQKASGDNTLLADLIGLDAELKLRAGYAIDLARYIKAIPDLHERWEAMDAAVDGVLRSRASASGGDIGSVARRLEMEHPSLRSFIQDAAALASATILRFATELSVPTLVLPCLLGTGGPGGGGRYELRRLIGQGAQGSVYLGIDRSFLDDACPAWVAVKVIASGNHSNGLLEEAVLARRIEHLNVARTLDCGTHGEHDYVVAEHVDGGTLEGALRAKQPWLTRPAVVGLLIQIASGLQAAHAMGLVHCDLKPGNILLTDRHTPKIADFGVARRLVTTSGEPSLVRGNLACMACEIYRDGNAAATPSSDVFGLGSILLYALTGLYPNGQSPQEAETSLKQGVRPPAVHQAIELLARNHPDLAAICRRATSPDARERYTSADAMAADLERVSKHQPLSWTKPSIRHRAALSIRRSPALVALALLGMVGTGLGSGVAAHTEGRRQQQELSNKLALVEEQHEKDRAVQSQLRNLIEFMADATAAVNKGNFSTDWLPMMTILEHVAGPVLFDSTNSTGIWAGRIDVVQAKLKHFDTVRAGTSVEASMWRTLLGYWMIRAHRYDDSLVVLARAHTDLQRQVGNDPWIGYISQLESLATLNEALSKDKSIERDHSLASSLDVLEAGMTELNSVDQNRTLQRVILDSMIKAAGTDGLSDSRRETRYRTLRDSLKQ